MIGVDSARNTSGAQLGALDPANSMFWSWNSGYIFVRMEGNSPQSTQPYNKLQFHIGGFKGATNCIKGEFDFSEETLRDSAEFDLTERLVDKG